MSAPMQVVTGSACNLVVTSRRGDQETITVKLLTVRDIGRYFQNGDDIAALAELFASKPTGWADTITTESAMNVVRIGEELNAGPLEDFVRFQQQRKAGFERIAKEVVQTT